MLPTIEFALALLAASAPNVSVRWQAPPACAEQRVVIERVEGLLGRSLSLPFDRPLDVTATATTVVDGYRVAIHTSEGAERVIDGATCDEIVDAASLVIAIAIDPSAITWQAPPVEASPPPPLPIKTSTTAPRSPGRDELRAPDIPFGIALPRLDFRAGVRAGTGILPEAGLGLSLGAAVLWAPLRFQGAISFWFDRHTSALGAAVDVGLWAFDGEACVAPEVGAYLEIPVCFGFELGRYAADAPDVVISPLREVWFAPTAGVGLAVVPMPYFAVVFEVEGLVSVNRPKLEDEMLGVLVEAGRFGIRGGIMLELRAP